MNFLSNLWGGIKNTFNDVKGYLGASALDAVNTLRGGDPSINKPPTQSTGVNMTYAPTMSTPLGQAAVADNGQMIVYGQGGTVNNLASAIANSGPLTSNDVRPSTYTSLASAATQIGNGSSQSTWTPKIDEYGRQSTRNEGTPYVNANGITVTPDRGFSGITGAGGGGFSTAQSTPQTGLSGLTGTDWARGFMGAGQGTTAGNYNLNRTEEEDKNNGEQILNPQDKALKMAQDVAPALTSGMTQGPNSPVVPPVIDAGYIQKATEEVAKLSSYTGADRNQIIGNLMTELQGAYNQLTVQAQNEGAMVADTKAMQDFFEQSSTSEEKLAKQQAVDQWVAENTSLNQLLSDKGLLEKQVRATDEAFLNQINTIKDNPNLPKALARRQVTDLLAVNDRATKGLVTRIADLASQINVQQKNVEMAFQLKRDAESDYQWAQEQQDKQINRFLNNPLLLAGMNSAQLQEFSQISGIPTKSLQTMANDAIKPNTESQIIGTSETGYYNIIKDKTTGKVLSKTLVMGGTGGGGGGETFKSGGASIPGSQISGSEQALLKSRGADGYADPTIYLNIYTNWTQKGGLVKDFLATFPPERYVNPANTWLPKEIMPEDKLSGLLPTK